MVRSDEIPSRHERFLAEGEGALEGTAQRAVGVEGGETCFKSTAVPLGRLRTWIAGVKLFCGRKVL